MAAETPCPNCGGLNYQGIQKCAHCGNAIDWNAIQPVAKPVPAARPARIDADISFGTIFDITFKVMASAFLIGATAGALWFVLRMMAAT